LGDEISNANSSTPVKFPTFIAIRCKGQGISENHQPSLVVFEMKVNCRCTPEIAEPK
jgi:hypothetical protein